MVSCLASRSGYSFLVPCVIDIAGKPAAWVLGTQMLLAGYHWILVVRAACVGNASQWSCGVAEDEAE